MNGTKIHKDIPYKQYLRWYRTLRTMFFSKSRPSAEYIKVDENIPVLRAIFGKEGYAPAWKFSYDEGEQLNLAFVYYDPENENWRQIHVRVWNEGDYRLISAHDELTPEEHPKEHLKGVAFRRGDGMAKVKNLLIASAVEHEMVQIE